MSSLLSNLVPALVGAVAALGIEAWRQRKANKTHSLQFKAAFYPLSLGLMHEAVKSVGKIFDGIANGDHVELSLAWDEALSRYHLLDTTVIQLGFFGSAEVAASAGQVRAFCFSVLDMLTNFEACVDDQAATLKEGNNLVGAVGSAMQRDLGSFPPGPTISVTVHDWTAYRQDASNGP